VSDAASDRIDLAASEVETLAELAKLIRKLRRREARRRNGAELTYRDLAAIAGWSHGIVGEYLTGRALPPTDRFDVLIRILGASPAEQGPLATARDRAEESRRQGPPASQGPAPATGLAPHSPSDPARRPEATHHANPSGPTRHAGPYADSDTSGSNHPAAPSGPAIHGKGDTLGPTGRSGPRAHDTPTRPTGRKGPSAHGENDSPTRPARRNGSDRREQINSPTGLAERSRPDTRGEINSPTGLAGRSGPDTRGEINGPTGPVRRNGPYAHGENDGPGGPGRRGGSHGRGENDGPGGRPHSERRGPERARSSGTTRTERDGPRDLPADVRGFTARESELAEMDGLLSGRRGAAMVISVISGAGGVGKTALAVHWAHRVAARFPDGQLYVDLRGHDPGDPLDPADALATLLRRLGVPPARIPDDPGERAAQYRTLLSGKHTLVLLDNAHCAEQVRPLLPGSSSCLLLVTSRNTLSGLVAAEGARRINLDTYPLTSREPLSHR
jgi:hypothetical protein